MQIIEKRIDELQPYKNNPRNNDGAVEAVAASIKEFGFKVPIIIDKDNVIVAGHTRLKAAQKLGIQTVPVILADDLTEEQVKAFRLADNKTAEMAGWDFSALEKELAEITDIDMALFGFANELLQEPVETEAGGVEDNTNKPVAVRIVFENAQRWREHENEIRAVVDNLPNVNLSVGLANEDQ